MTYVAAAIFFSLAFLAAATALHLIVRTHWQEIILALRGELGAVRPSSARPVAMPRRRAAV